jgi:hypothetical protein
MATRKQNARLRRLLAEPTILDTPATVDSGASTTVPVAGDGNLEHSCFIIGSRIPETCYPSMIGAREWRLRCGHCFREWWFGDANERPEGKCDARI